jgi:hypothetical protein
MSRLLAIVLFISSQAFAHTPYELIQFENDTFRDYSYEELASSLRETRPLLDAYRCNGRDEYDFFWAPLRSNPLKSSLRVKAKDSADIFIYQEGLFYDQAGNKVLSPKDPFVKSVKEALQKLEQVPMSAALLRHLEVSYYPLTIERGMNSFNVKEENGRDFFGLKMATALSIFVNGRTSDDILPFYDIGVGGIIYWNPKLQDPPAYIALAHEMYHAFDSIRGILDLRLVSGQDYEFIGVSEYRAVYFENMIRKAFGIAYRTHYTNDTDGPGVLNQLGQPVMMPSPCLQ